MLTGSDAGLARSVRFEDALAEHLAAIHSRDFDRLARTVSPRELVLVTAQGEVSTDPARFLALHRDWFASTTWLLDARRLHAYVASDVATCLLELDYRDRRDDGTVIRERSILHLVFQRQDGTWLLVQDQNTPCRASG